MAVATPIARITFSRDTSWDLTPEQTSALNNLIGEEAFAVFAKLFKTWYKHGPQTMALLEQRDNRTRNDVDHVNSKTKKSDQISQLRTDMLQLFDEIDATMISLTTQAAVGSVASHCVTFLTEVMSMLTKNVRLLKQRLQTNDCKTRNNYPAQPRHKKHHVRDGRGRPRLFTQLPRLAEVVDDFISQNDSKAEAKRRSSTKTSGATCPSIAAHVRTKMNIDISTSTVRRLGKAPNAGRKAAAYYQVHSARTCFVVIAFVGARA